jgi:hypothetical protein
MMMAVKVKTADFSYSVKSMVGGERKCFPGGLACAQKGIVRVIHLVTSENCLERILVESLIMCYERQSINEWFNPPPHHGKNGSVIGHLPCYPVYARTPICVKIGLWLYQRIECICHLATTNNDKPHTAYAGAFVISRFKIYGSKVEHTERNHCLASSHDNNATREAFQLMAI